MSLLVVLGVHEVVVIAIVVEEFHGDFVDDDALNGIGRAEAVLKHGTGAQVAQLGLDKGAQVARRAMLDGKDGMQLVVVLDDHARTHLCGGNRHKGKKLLASSYWEFCSRFHRWTPDTARPAGETLQHLILAGEKAAGPGWPAYFPPK